MRLDGLLAAVEEAARVIGSSFSERGAGRSGVICTVPVLPAEGGGIRELAELVRADGFRGSYGVRVFGLAARAVPG